jgi:hypothetical protein
VFVGEATDVMVMVGVCWCFCFCFLGLGSGFGGLAGCGLFLFLVQKVCPTTVLGAVADACGRHGHGHFFSFWLLFGDGFGRCFS